MVKKIYQQLKNHQIQKNINNKRRPETSMGRVEGSEESLTVEIFSNGESAEKPMKSKSYQNLKSHMKKIKVASSA